MSAMIVVSFVLYYMITRYGRSRIVCPVCSIFLLGYLLQEYGTIVAVHDNGAFFNLGIVRAVAEMSMGIFMYQVVSRIHKCEFIHKNAVLFAVVKYVLLLVVLLTCLGFFGWSYYHDLFLVLCFVFVLINVEAIPRLHLFRTNSGGVGLF